MKRKYNRRKEYLKFFHNIFPPICAIPVLFTLFLNANAQTGRIANVHDPCIIKCEDYYYIYSTGDKLVARRSKDLIDWQYIGSVFETIPSWGKTEIPGVSNIWAPDIFCRDGTYYLYYSLSTFGSNRSCIGLATNEILDPNDPKYKWVDRGKVFESNTADNYNAIDPNIITDANGDIWMSFGSFWSGIQMVQLLPTTMKPPAGIPTVFSIAGRGGGAIEAPFIVYRRGYYYLFVSFDLCCRGVNSTYNIRVGRSSQVSGPYLDKNNTSMLNSGGTLLLSGDTRWKGPGHCAVYNEGDAYYLVYHAYDANDNGIPTLRINDLLWTEDSWPVVDEFSRVHQEGLDGDPAGYALFQNFPNPFNSSTTIHCSIEKPSWVCLKIYDPLGNEIETLINDKLEPGVYPITWRPDDLASGVYLCRLRIDEFSQTKKLLLVK
jgi:arabinan endo-1,5-alpha-L-arabinosidase